MWYFIFSSIVTILVILDAKRRRMRVIGWALGAFLLPFVVTPFYYANRSLKAGEMREGGKGWNVLKMFVLFWTIIIAIASIASFISVGEHVSTLQSDAERAGAAIGTTIGFAMIGAIWFLPTLAALVIGLFIKKSTIIEKGPTGRLAENIDLQHDSSVQDNKSKELKYIIIALGVFIFLVTAIYFINGRNSTNFHKTISIEEAVTKCKSSYGEDAIIYCDLVLKKIPSDYEAGKKYDNEMVNVGRGQELVKHYQNAISTNPSDADLHFRLCRVYFSMKAYDDSISECQKAIDIRPTMALAYVNIGKSYDAKKQFNDAIKLYDKAIELDPSMLGVYKDKAITLTDMKDYDEAFKTVDIALGLKTSDDSVYALKGSIYETINKNKEAVSIYKTGLSLYPDSVRLLAAYGSILSKEGRYSESIEYLTKALNIDLSTQASLSNPNLMLAIIYNALGNSQYHLGNKNEALNSFRKSVEHNPDSSEIKDVVSLIEKELGTVTMKGDASNGEHDNPINIGTPFRLGDFTYTVQRIKKLNSVGNEYFGYKAQEGAVLLLVQYTIHNESNETKTVITDDFTLSDYKGRSFRSSSDANTAYMMGGGKKDFLISEIQPGLKRDMASVFEVPMDAANNGGLRLIVPEKGWGTKKVSITLN